MPELIKLSHRLVPAPPANNVILQSTIYGFGWGSVYLKSLFEQATDGMSEFSRSTYIYAQVTKPSGGHGDYGGSIGGSHV